MSYVRNRFGEAPACKGGRGLKRSVNVRVRVRPVTEAPACKGWRGLKLLRRTTQPLQIVKRPPVKAGED